MQNKFNALNKADWLSGIYQLQLKRNLLIRSASLQQQIVVIIEQLVLMNHFVIFIMRIIAFLQKTFK